MLSYVVLAACLIAAFGVTVVALKNWKGDRYLCDDCVFNNDNDCSKVEKPKAVSCTVYRSEAVGDYRM